LLQILKTVLFISLSYLQELPVREKRGSSQESMPLTTIGFKESIPERLALYIQIKGADNSICLYNPHNQTSQGLFLLLGSLGSWGALPIASSCKILCNEFISQVWIFSLDKILQTFAV